MLRKTSGITGYSIAASDGRLGTVSDLLFDDVGWRVRWLVVDTGNWLSGRKVLLPTSVLGHLDTERAEFSVRLSMQQVEDSPDIDTDKPVSRQMETRTYGYYGWTPYWGSGLYVGGGLGLAMAASSYLAPAQHPASLGETRHTRGDPHLRSVVAVTGYHIHASDGGIGHVEDFLVEDADWSIRFLIVDTSHWWPAKKVLISPRSAHEIDWAGRRVTLDVDRQTVKDSPTYDAATPIDRTYETKFDSHYADALGGRDAGTNYSPSTISSRR